MLATQNQTPHGSPRWLSQHPASLLLYSQPYLCLHMHCTDTAASPSLREDARGVTCAPGQLRQVSHVLRTPGDVEGLPPGVGMLTPRSSELLQQVLGSVRVEVQRRYWLHPETRCPALMHPESLPSAGGPSQVASPADPGAGATAECEPRLRGGRGPAHHMLPRLLGLGPAWWPCCSLGG